MSLSDLYAHLRASRLVQAGAALVILGGLTEACDQLSALDLTQVPLVGAYAPQVLACVGVAKILFRLAMVLIGAFSPTAKTDEADVQQP
jgi:hypothetical protein